MQILYFFYPLCRSLSLLTLFISFLYMRDGGMLEIHIAMK